MARRPARGGSAKKPKVSLIVTDDKDVRVRVRPGAKLRVVAVETLTPDLKKGGPIGARLCGYGTNVCLALLDIGK
jgi:hypothetical protein